MTKHKLRRLGDHGGFVVSERCEFLLSKALRRLAQVVAEHARLEAETVCEKADAMHGRTLMTGPTNLSAEKSSLGSPVLAV